MFLASKEVVLMDVRLERGDIYLTRGKGLFAWLIRICTSKIGEKRSKVNHVGIVVEAGGMKEAVAVEAYFSAAN